MRRDSWLLAGLGGILLGIGLFTFRYAEGFSYFSKDPEACANCHIMNSQYHSWSRSSHHAAATCVDCHLPAGFPDKYFAKAENGYHHSKGFTLQDFHEPIMIKEKNREILQANCIACHEQAVHGLVTGATTDPGAVSCLHCHADVGHGETAGLGGPDRGEFAERIQP